MSIESTDSVEAYVSAGYQKRPSSEMPSYKLIYFDGRGRGELPRLVFAAAGEKYEDFRFGFAEWPTTPFGQTPVLEVDGKQLPETYAITRYLANQFGLAGSGAWEQGLVDANLQVIADVMWHVANAFDAKEPEKGPLIGNFVGKIFPQYLEHMENFIKKNGRDGYVVGKKLTVADIALFYVIDTVELVIKSGTLERASQFPEIKAVYDSVVNHENIGSYLKGRPESKF